ncbi:hypothetical protein EIY87_30620 [Amycolatopsis eburnea]|uniref:Uncharacterized protein n=1 Tax=Amycolatopsis eburnea TaxID=2267691 RepID=A0A3R9DXB1_9PSEU|nr:hypothetical protein EIY87_30620 [Amycolatopsis eburnea]
MGPRGQPCRLPVRVQLHGGRRRGGPGGVRGDGQPRRPLRRRQQPGGQPPDGNDRGPRELISFGRGPKRPNVALVASNAPNATLGALDAPNATLGRSGPGTTVRAQPGLSPLSPWRDALVPPRRKITYPARDPVRSSTPPHPPQG